MRIINHYNLADRVLKVIEGINPTRERPKENVIHVTQLLMPAYVRRLLIEKWDEVQADYSDRLLTAQGTALHEAYEKYLENDGYIREHNMNIEIEGVTLTGTCDLYNPFLRRLVDVKQSSVWQENYKIPDWTKQTNVYRWMLAKENNAVDEIFIDLWYRNWKLSDKDRQGWQYPEIPYREVQIEVWPLEKIEEFIKDQIHYLTMCKDKCSRQDKWQKYGAFRSTNGKQKQNPDKNFDDLKEAQEWIKNWTPEASCLKSMPKGKITWELVDSEPTNCLYFCPSRSVCEFAKSLGGKK